MIRNSYNDIGLDGYFVSFNEKTVRWHFSLAVALAKKNINMCKVKLNAYQK